jgi:hypothetical protein
MPTDAESETERYPHALTLRHTEESYEALRQKAHVERSKITHLIRQPIASAYGIDVEPQAGRKGGSYGPLNLRTASQLCDREG